MKNNLRIVLPVILFWLSVWPAAAHAAVINAASCSQADVQSAINSASSGDTVVIPGGTCAWSSTVTIPNTKGITLYGQGTTTISGGPLQVNSSTTAANVTRVTGITFSGTFGATPAIATSGCGGLASCGGITTAYFRIDDCAFNAINSGAVFITTSGNGPGLIDDNTFTGGAASEMIHNLAMGTSDPTSWTDSVMPGGPNMLFIEDNTFTYPASGNPAYDYGTQALESYYGARTVFRHNTLNMVEVDQHGTPSLIWTRWFEIYNNTFNTTLANAAQSTYITLRGGSGVVFNNTHVGTNGSGLAGIGIWVECGSAGVMCTSSATYPQPYQIGRGINQNLSPVYLWNNTDPQMGGTMTTTSQSVLAQANIDYYVSSSQPASLLRQEMSTDTSATTYSYTPYTYPHPLRYPLPPSGANAVGH